MATRVVKTAHAPLDRVETSFVALLAFLERIVANVRDSFVLLVRVLVSWVHLSKHIDAYPAINNIEIDFLFFIFIFSFHTCSCL